EILRSVVQGLPITRLCLGKITLRLESNRQIKMCLDKIRAKAHGLSQAGQRFFEMSQLTESIAQVAARQGEVRLRVGRRPKAIDCLRQFGLQNEDVAQVVVGRGKVRL